MITSLFGCSRDSPLQSTPIQTLVVSTSSDDLLSPSPSSVPQSTPILRNSHSNVELNSNKTPDLSLDYYNYCAPKLPAHSNDSNKSLTLSSGHRVLQSNGVLHSHKSAEILSPDSPDPGAANYSKLSKIRQTADTASDSDIPSPAYASIDDFNLKLDSVPSGEDKLKLRSLSCDCLDACEPTSKTQAAMISGRSDSHNAMYDKLTPLISANHSIYDSLGPSKDDLMSGSSSPDHSDDPTDQKAIYLRRKHKYEYIDVEMENRSSDKSGSTSPIGMEHPSDWTSSLPVGFVLRERCAPRTSVSKETKTLPRRKQLPLQESGGEQSSSETEYSTLKKVKPPRMSREYSVETPDSRAKPLPLSANLSRVSQARSSADSTEVISSSDSTRRESVFSNGSNSSVELEAKHSTALDHARREHSNSPSHRVTREDVAIRTKGAESPQDHTDSQPQSPAPPIPKRGSAEPSLKSPPEKPKYPTKPAVNGSPPLPPRSLEPPRSQEQPRFTVPLPQAQFDFFKPSPPPKPKVLCPSDLSYAAVTFSNGEKTIYSHVDPVVGNSRPSIKISQTHSDVSYVAVDFEMTAGLQRTSEQVADHHREFFETKQQS